MARVLEKYPLTIIMPVLNCLDYTKQAIASIKTKYDYQLILIDNNSTDGTDDYFRTLKQFPIITTWRAKKNWGVSTSWNFGLVLGEVAFHSRYFLIINNDILLNPKTIDTLIDEIRRPDVLLVSGKDMAGRISWCEDVKTLVPPVKRVREETPEFSCFMLKAETLKRVGYFDENFYPAYFEDNDYHYRIKLAGFHAYSISNAYYYHFGSRTIKEHPEIKRITDIGYTANWDYYKRKWGGDRGHEKFTRPFEII